MPQIKLKKSLNFPLLLFYSTGTILGLGIYVILGKIIGEAGTLAPIAFLVASILAIFSGFSYSELSARIPKSGGVVNYVDEAFHKDWLSKISGWMLVVSAIISTATVLNGYVGYVHVFVEIAPWIIISIVTIVLSGVAIWGITQSAATITVITSIELLGIFLVILLAGDNLVHFPERAMEFVPSLDANVWKGIFMGAFLAFFTFIGFEDVVNVAEESKNPQKDMPRAIICSLLILTVLYIIISIIGILGLSPEELDSSTAPLADILAKKNPSYPYIISAIGLIAIINGVLVQIVMNARVLYGMARKNLAPKIFGKLNKRTRTPIWSTIFASGIILALALLFDLESLAKATNYILLIVFSLINLSLIIIKRKTPKVKGVKSYPMIVPILGLFFSTGLFVFQFYMTFFH
ncbi:amino acid permease [Candidatus Peregrinibacteria bacterium]|nr:amino acid permease [Candidatus Peregrinibacteria bacterium]